MARTNKTPPPAEGAAFAVPLEDGRYSACRVILGSDRKRAKDEGGLVLVATSAWIGDQMPTADDPAVRPILRRPRFNGELGLNWMLDSLPTSFVPIGMIKPMPGERRLVCSVFCVWEAVAVDALDQWRWEHDREALLAEEAASSAEAKRNAESANRQRAAALKRLTLNDLTDHEFFARWPGYVAPA